MFQASEGEKITKDFFNKSFLAFLMFSFTICDQNYVEMLKMQK